MRKMFTRLTPFAGLVVLSALFLAGSSLASLQLPALLAECINYGVLPKDLRMVLYIGGKMLGTAAVALVCSLGTVYCSSRISTGFSANLRSDLFAKVQSLSVGEADRFGTATLITRTVNDVGQIQHFIMMLLRNMLSAPITAVGGIYLAFSSSPRLSGIVLLILPLMVLVVVGISRMTMPLTLSLIHISLLNLILWLNRCFAQVPGQVYFQNHTVLLVVCALYLGAVLLLWLRVSGRVLRFFAGCSAVLLAFVLTLALLLEQNTLQVVSLGENLVLAQPGGTAAVVLAGRDGSPVLEQLRQSRTARISLLVLEGDAPFADTAAAELLRTYPVQAVSAPGSGAAASYLEQVYSGTPLPAGTPVQLELGAGARLWYQPGESLRVQTPSLTLLKYFDSCGIINGMAQTNTVMVLPDGTVRLGGAVSGFSVRSLGRQYAELWLDLAEREEAQPWSALQKRS